MERIHMKIVLASGSPRRRELLTGLGLDYTVLVSGVEEHVTEREPAKVVEELSDQKARDVLQKLLSEVSNRGTDTQDSANENLRQELHFWDGREGLLVIGADTIVAADGQILGKPASVKDAAKMLGWLTRRHSFHECTQVHFYPMSEEEISWYISTGEPMDKAGAYGIQGLGSRFVKAIEGDYSNVVGLPVARLYQEMKIMQIIR